MNKQELIKSIDATYLKFGYDEGIHKKILDGGFENFCLHPINLKKFTRARLYLWTPIAVFNFPFAGSSISSVVKDMRYYKYQYKEADIVLPQYGGSDYSHFSRSSLIQLRDSFKGKILKAIIEPDLLFSNNDWIEKRCKQLVKIGFDYIKTHTGFGPRGVEVDDIKRIKDIVGDSIKIKASGGIRTLDQLMELKEAGADRFGIGIDSAINIVNEFDERNG